MRQASAVRDANWGQRITYSRKVFIPLTNMCRNTCGYCVFVKHPADPAANYLSLDQLVAIAKRGQELGCKEALFSLGERPEDRYPKAASWLQRLGFDTTVDYLAAACRAVLEQTSLIPHVNAGTMSRAEMTALRSVCGSMGLMLESNSKRLMKKGMPHYACPDKSPVLRMRTLELAGDLGVPFTTGILIGIGETWQERVDTLQAIRDAHCRHGHVQEVIVQNFRAKRETAMAEWAEPTHDDMLRTLAAARLILPPDVSLQAPPNLDDRFEDYIAAGINDWGGISPLTVDHINPERAWPALAVLGARTEQQGYELAERLTVYPRHFERCPAELDLPLRRLARADGLALEQYVS